MLPKQDVAKDQDRLLPERQAGQYGPSYSSRALRLQSSGGGADDNEPEHHVVEKRRR